MTVDATTIAGRRPSPGRRWWSAWRRRCRISRRSTTTSSATISGSSSCSRASRPATFRAGSSSSWMDEIWGHVPDEVRPLPGGVVPADRRSAARPSPFLHHALNIALHAANGLVVLAIALQAARLSLPAATLAAAVFVLLPVHGESVAWITGRVDSMPALFYMAGVLGLRALAGSRARGRAAGTRCRWRCCSSRSSPSRRRSRWSATLVGLGPGDPRAGRRPLWPWIRAYLPFALLTAAYLALRFVLFGQVVRESTLNAGGAAVLRAAVPAPSRQRRRRPGVGAASRHGPLSWRRRCGGGLACGGCRRTRGRRALASAAVLRPGVVGDRRGADRGRRLRIAAPRLPGGGRVGDRARHPRRSGLASAPGRRPPRRVGAALALASCAFYAVGCTGSWGEWNRMAAVSHQAVVDVRREVLASPRADAGHRRRADAQLGVGGAVLGPPAIHPHRPDPAGVHHHALAAALLPRPVARGHAPHPARLARAAPDPIVVLRWDPDTGQLSKVTEREYPALRTVAEVLLQLDSREALDANILRHGRRNCPCQCRGIRAGSGASVRMRAGPGLKATRLKAKDRLQARRLPGPLGCGNRLEGARRIDSTPVRNTVQALGLQPEPTSVRRSPCSSKKPDCRRKRRRCPGEPRRWRCRNATS